MTFFGLVIRAGTGRVGVRWARGAARVDGPALLRAAVADHLGARADAVTIRQVCLRCGGPHGRPTITVDGAPGPYGSLTRTGDLVAVAVADRPVGIDAEPVDLARDEERLAAVALTPMERRRLAQLEPAERATAVVRGWVRKEAILKCTGHGLEVDPARVAVALGPAPALVAWDGPGRRPRLRLAEVDLAPGIVATVARAGRRPLHVEVREVQLSER